jgi:3-oxoacyl-[acyl-carrier protein] reductase
MDLQLSGKVALIAGGSKGLGFGVAQALAREGVAVALLAREAGALDAAVDKIRQQGGTVAGFTADLSRAGDIETALEQVRRQFGDIDILLNNSGGPPASGVAGVDAALWEAQFRSMILPVFGLTDLLLPAMRRKKWGRILNIASSSVIEPIAAIGISNTLRSAVAGWAKTLAGEVARDGITVNTLLPGRIATDRTVALDRRAAEQQGVSAEAIAAQSTAEIPLGRYGTVEEFGAVAAFLASPLASYVTGSLVRVDGGMMRSV